MVTWAGLWAGQRTNGQKGRNWLLLGGIHFAPRGPGNPVSCVCQPDPNHRCGTELARAQRDGHTCCAHSLYITTLGESWQRFGIKIKTLKFSERFGERLALGTDAQKAKKEIKDKEMS